jgi:antitoxin FitA
MPDDRSGASLASLTIRKLDPAVKERLPARAAQHGRSMEDEARRILAESCGPAARQGSLADTALGLFGPEGGADLELPPRQQGREPPSFG